MTLDDARLDFSDLISIATSNPWIIICLIAAILSFVVCVAVARYADSGSPIVGLMLFTFTITFTVAGAHTYYDSQAQHVQTVEAWLSDTYGIDTEISEKKAGSFLAQSNSDQITIRDSGRVLNLVVTADEHLIVVDTGGEEVERIPDK